MTTLYPEQLRELKKRKFKSTMRNVINFVKPFTRGGYLRLAENTMSSKYLVQLQVEFDELKDAIDVVKAIDDLLTKKGVKVDEKVYEW